MITVRLIRPWRRFDTGRKLQRTNAAAEVLVARGIAEYVSLAKTRKPIAKPPGDAEPKASTDAPADKTKYCRTKKRKAAPTKRAAKKTPTKRKAAPKKRAAKKPAPKRTAKKAKR